MQNNVIKFSDLELNSSILSSLEDISFEIPTPIQSESIPKLLKGYDLLGRAQTGTGKTAAFSLPLLNKIEIINKKPQALIMTPTRELTLQVASEIKKLGKNIKGLKVTEIYGGASIGEQIKKLKIGSHIIVGTPGRVKDLITRRRLELNELKSLVLDEADEMLKMGFIEDVKWIIEQTPESTQRILFSATIPKEIIEIVNKFLKNPVHIDVANTKKTVDKVKQLFCFVDKLDKIEVLSRLIEFEKPECSIVFVKTKQDTEKVSNALSKFGFRSSALHGDIAQSMREKIIDSIKKGNIDILVATDVVARGLDISHVSHVFNYDAPFNVDSYIHRIGRTGRAGREGKAIILIENFRILRNIERFIKSKIEEIKIPNIKDIIDIRVKKLCDEILYNYENKKIDKFLDLIEHIQNTLEIDLKSLCAILLKRQTGNKLINNNDDLLSMLENRRNFINNKQNSDSASVTYRFSVGRSNNIQVKDIVGALTHEVGYKRNNIGKIKLFNNYSLIELPKKMNDNTSYKLKKLQIRQYDVNAKLYNHRKYNRISK